MNRQTYAIQRVALAHPQHVEAGGTNQVGVECPKNMLKRSRDVAPEMPGAGIFASRYANAPGRSLQCLNLFRPRGARVRGNASHYIRPVPMS